MKHCYNCGCELTKNEETKEHIPMKALFRGYPLDKLDKPITVPACNTCNNRYSKIEEDFKNIIALWAANENTDISDDFIHSSIRSPKLYSKLRTQHDQIIAVFNIKDYNDVHIKNFKGLYYKLYGKPLPKSYQIGILADLSSNPKDHPFLNMFMKERFPTKALSFVGHKDIFQYRMVDLDFGIMCTMIYFKKLFAHIYAIRK